MNVVNWLGKNMKNLKIIHKTIEPSIAVLGFHVLCCYIREGDGRVAAGEERGGREGGRRGKRGREMGRG